MRTRTLTGVLVLGLAASGCADQADAVESDEVGADGKADGPSAGSLEQYNHYPSDRQSYQLDTRGLLDARRLAAFEYVNRAIEDKFPSYTLQSFKTYPTFEYAFIFKDKLPVAAGSNDPHHCLKIKAVVATSPTDAFPEITRVKFLPDAIGEALCRDNGEI